MSDDINVPADATAMQAEAIVRAAIAWAWTVQPDDRMGRNDWKLYEACTQYGDDFKGLRAG